MSPSDATSSSSPHQPSDTFSLPESREISISDSFQSESPSPEAQPPTSPEEAPPEASSDPETQPSSSSEIPPATPSRFHIPTTAWVMAACLTLGGLFLFYKAAAETRSKLKSDLEAAKTLNSQLGQRFAEVESNKKSAALLQLKAENSNNLRDNIVALREESKRLSAQLASIETSTKKSLSQLRIVADEYLAIQQAKARSLRISELQTNSGRIFSEVTISRVHPEELAIQHSEGATRIPSSDLPEWLKLRCGYQLPEPVASILAGTTSALDSSRPIQQQTELKPSAADAPLPTIPPRKPQVQLNPLPPGEIAPVNPDDPSIQSDANPPAPLDNTPPPNKDSSLPGDDILDAIPPTS